MVNAAKEVTYGAIAGSLGKLIEFPFDTVKVRLQSSHHPASTIKMVLSIFHNEGLFNGFYKGIRAPMVGACMESAVLFSAFQYGQQGLAKVTDLPADSLVRVCAAGAFSGFSASFVLTPVELVKCKLQVSNVNSATANVSYMSIIRKILHNEGPIGLWHGLNLTLLREMGGTAVWFASYEQSLKFLNKKNPQKETMNLLVSGAVAGFMFNLSIFPIDTIKSIIQTYDMTSGLSKKLTFVSAFKHLTGRQGGVRNLYNGLGITLVRSIPANAAIFYTYEFLKKNY